MLLAAIPRVEQRRMLRVFTAAPGVLGILVVMGAAIETVLVATGMIGDSTPARLYIMPPLTGITLIIAGLSLIIAQRKDSAAAKWISRSLAIIVAIIGLLVLVEYSLNRAVAVDNFWPTLLGSYNPFPQWQRMAINSALALVLFAQGILFLDGDRRADGLRSQLFAMLSLIIAFIAIVGHIFSVQELYSFQDIGGVSISSAFAGMSLSSAIALTLLGLGLLFSQLNRGVPALVVDDGAAGFVARRLLPGAIFLPFFLTTFFVAGVQRGFFERNLGASIFAVANMVAFLLLIAWSARFLRDIDRKRGELFVLEREAHEASEKARAEAELAMQQAEAARAEAESANGAKSDFLAVMSHELRTPLAAIMGYQELLADGITGPITEAQGQQLGRIKASARHLLSLIDEILTFTRLDAGRETVVPEVVDVDAMLRDAIEIVEPLAEAKKLEMKIVSPGPGITIETDPIKVRQILVNLLSNAVKFTDKGTVTAEGSARGSGATLRVIDTGIGIQPEFLHKIFDPFWQVEQKATRRATGTGLGLTVTKRLANLLGGDVDVNSTPGEGTTFTVTLPAKAPHIAPLPERATKLRAG